MSDNKVLVVSDSAMGFTQTRVDSGLVSSWLSLRSLSKDNVMILQPRHWRDDPKEEVEFLKLVAPDAKIVFTSYSWGAGWFFLRFQKHAMKIGLDIAHAILIDPVVRYGVLPSRFSPISLASGFSFLPLSYPVYPCVKKVSYFYQRENRPQGHKLKVIDRTATMVVRNRKLDVIHSEMEDHPMVHREICEAVITAIEESKT